MERWARRTLIAVVLLTALLLPLASDFPDGLEKVAETLGVEEIPPFWNAPLPDYTVPLTGNQYLRTLLAGLTGLLLVLIATWGLGYALRRRRESRVSGR
ncbi:MAG: PDGLE domain-containing protein [Candidatus Bathyarchaeia archaeon]